MGRRVRPAHLVMEQKILGHLETKKLHSRAASLCGRAVTAEASPDRATIVVTAPAMPMSGLLSRGLTSQRMQKGLWD